MLAAHHTAATNNKANLEVGDGISKFYFFVIWELHFDAQNVVFNLLQVLTNRFNEKHLVVLEKGDTKRTSNQAQVDNNIVVCGKGQY